ncbi:MAG: transcription antiterminator, partial [Ruminococcus flavefaciens]|nr:transcription antiterminator [Ruminococcus flavefaciens]
MMIYEKLLNGLSVEYYITAERLGEQTFLSEKTVRNYMKGLNDFLKPYGASIEVKHGKGYRLAVRDERLFSGIYKEGILKNERNMPIGAEERVDFIIMYLLCHFDYVQIEEFINIMCISESTLQSDLRRTRNYLKEYDVKLENRVKKGIRAVGTEFNLRAALVNYVMKRGMIGESEIFLAEKEKKRIFSIVMDSLLELDISMSEVSMQNVVLHLYVAIKRIKSGRKIDIELNTHNEITKNFSQESAVARNICKRLESIFHIHFSQDEQDYITLYLTGNRAAGSDRKDTDNMIISPGIQELVKRMLQYIYATMRVDFRDNFPLIMMLSQHMVALEIRVKYNIRLNNPFLNEIKEKYSKAYVVAIQACVILENYYNKKLREAEAGYLAVIFHLHLENIRDRERETVKKNILIICAMGKASAQMLAYQYRKMFGQYLDRVEICNRSNVENVDLQNIDYILTTTPISFKVPIPVIEIKMFLDEKETSRLQNQFAR